MPPRYAVMPVKVKDCMESYDSIVKKLRKAMREQGTYSKAMEISISLAAGSYMAYLKACDAIKDMDICSERKSREGHVYKIINPEFTVMVDMAEQTRKALRELRLTRATIESGSDEDEVDQLIKEVENAGKKRPNKA